MASMLLMKTLTTKTRCLPSPAPVRFSPPAVYTTVIPLRHSVAAAAAFRRPSASVTQAYCCNDQPEPQLEEKVEVEIEEDTKMENENEEQSEKKEADIADKYNTSQKILIACVGDFSFAHHIASKLGDARNIVVICPDSCDETERVHEDARAKMLQLKELGATIHFSVDVMNFRKDSRVNHTLYDHTLLVIMPKNPFGHNG